MLGSVGKSKWSDKNVERKPDGTVQGPNRTMPLMGAFGASTRFPTGSPGRLRGRA